MSLTGTGRAGPGQWVDRWKHAFDEMKSEVIKVLDRVPELTTWGRLPFSHLHTQREQLKTN